MAFNEEYTARAALLVQILPLIEGFRRFALKGGTAINLFYRDLPRLSVDVDLTYLPLQDRSASIAAINDELAQLKGRIERSLGVKVQHSFSSAERLSKLFVHGPAGLIKVEPNYLLRGSCLLPVERSLCASAARLFKAEVNVQCLAFEDLYAGKLCAALDRQHPRDLFDVKMLLDEEGITARLRQVFIVYLLQCGRPAVELLQPTLLDIEPLFRAEFSGMSGDADLKSLREVQQRLAGLLVASFTAAERAFLLSFENGSPEWPLLELGDFSNLPGVQWKLVNLEKADQAKRQLYHDKLEALLQAE